MLRGIVDGSVTCLARDTPMPSQFSHEILNANPYAYLDDAPLEERRARAVEMRRTLPEAALGEIGRLDPAAIAEVREDIWPDVRDAEELHDTLLSLIAVPAAGGDGHGQAYPGMKLAESVAAWGSYFDELSAERRAGVARVEGRSYWVAAERARAFAQAFPSAQLPDDLPQLESKAISREDALAAVATGWLAHTGPMRASELAELLGVAAADMEKTFLRLEASGAILRGQFAQAEGGEAEWCERRILARIHRLTIGRLRKQIEPVTPAQFMSWLLRWQHVATGSQLLGERGLLEALSQLQGFEAPARAWEPQILARRVANYDPKLLDQLCLTGVAGWGRLSQPAAALDGPVDGRPAQAGRRRVTPTSVTPITFFIREDAEWMALHSGPAERPALSHAAVAVLSFLHARGASFFADIVRATGSLKSEVESALWELVAAGLLTADGFDNLRALIDPKRRAGRGNARGARPRHSAGRWSLLHSGAGEDAAQRQRSGLLDAAAALRDRVSRAAGAGNDRAAMARTADRAAAAGGSRGDTRRQIRERIHRRAIRAAGGGRISARGSHAAGIGANHDRFCGRSAQPRWHSGAGRTRGGELRQDGGVSRRRGRVRGPTHQRRGKAS